MKIFSLALIFTTFCLTVNAQKFTDKINVKKGQTTEVVSVMTQSMNMGMEMLTKSTITSSAKVMEVSNSDFKIIGFLKNEPLFPKTLGSGNLLCRIAITALLTSRNVGVSILFFTSSAVMSPYDVLIL